MKKWLARTFLQISGWRTESAPPEVPKYVLVAAPHTSNWDFPFMIAAAFLFDMPLVWMGKQSLFRFPQGALLRALGGVAVDRSRRTNMVDAWIDEIRSRDRVALAVPAEGTRSQSEFWKSGFYHIARGAGVPIVLGFVDFDRKRVGFGPTIAPSGDVRADMDVVRSFYDPSMARHPERFTVPRLREETQAPDSTG